MNHHIFSTIKSRALRALRYIGIAACLLAPLGMQAVTEAEMDNAKAIAAKFYIRFVNDGAGYLDNWTPKSMAELEQKLTNDKDRQLLRQFKNAPTPTDFASWDKAQLVAYWSGEFFTENASRLDAKGATNGLAKKQINKAVSQLKVTPPSASQPAQEAAQAASAQDDVADSMALAQEAADEAQLAQTEEAVAQAQNIETAAEEEVKSSESSGTWVYVLVLALLVGVVIFLVIYASKTMKGQPIKSAPQPEQPTREEEIPRSEPLQPAREEREVVATPVANDTRMREKYAENLAAKAEEIRVLTRQLSEMESLAAGLKEENRKLKAQLEQQRHAAYKPSHETPSPEPSAGPREVYLGRVNSKGIFVRADRHAVDGQSIFKLTTSDGVTGTFALINNPLIEEQVLDDPEKWLAGGCFAKDIYDTEGREGVRTETPGKAVFRDGAWRVERKAKIRYE